MTLYIPENYLRDSGLTEASVRLELAIMLFQKEHLTLGQAAKIAGLHKMIFQRKLAEQKIPVHYGIDELNADMETLNLTTD